MRGKHEDQPYKILGGRLRMRREKLSESLAEASGAVEIDVEDLEKIEMGLERPSEEILMLLISHFDINEDEATELWELADYIEEKSNTSGTMFEAGKGNETTAFVLPMDIRVVYTDMVHVMVNNFGVVMNFIQNSGPNNQPLVVARVGMSREHAESVIQILQQALAQADRQTIEKPKSLPAPQTKKPKTDI